jgi:hypothetical protein
MTKQSFTYLIRLRSIGRDDEGIGRDVKLVMEEIAILSLDL